MKMMTDVFICPSTGWGVFLVYDEEECELYARVCDENVWAPDLADEGQLSDCEETELWCCHFGYRRGDAVVEAMDAADMFQATF